MKRLTLFAVVVALLIPAATLAIAQESQDEPMYVSLTYVSVKPEMTPAFMAAIGDHLEWHKSTGDTHYYTVSQVVSGPRTGQFLFAAGPMTGAQMDEATAFSDQDMGDIAGRGVMSYVDAVESIVLRTMPALGNPPPPGTMMPMVHVYEFDLHHDHIQAFDEALAKYDEAAKANSPADSYDAWVMPVSGTGFNKRWFVNWVEGWADSAPDEEMEAKVMETLGGEEAYMEIAETFMSAIRTSNVTTYVSLPQLSFGPEGR